MFVAIIVHFVVIGILEILENIFKQCSFKICCSFLLNRIINTFIEIIK